MDRIKEGIITVDGIELNADTTIADLEKVEIDKGVQRDHPHGYFELIFNHPIVSDGVEFQVSIRILKKSGHKIILLNPKNSVGTRGFRDTSREDQQVSEQWLKRNLDVEPTRDTDEGIFYEFPWGYITSTAAEHINFGHLEGGIIITYGQDASGEEM